MSQNAQRAAAMTVNAYTNSTIHSEMQKYRLHRIEDEWIAVVILFQTLSTRFHESHIVKRQGMEFGRSIQYFTPKSIYFHYVKTIF